MATHRSPQPRRRVAALAAITAITAIAALLGFGALLAPDIAGADVSQIDAASFGKHIASFDSDITVNKDGSIDVVETIVYDFANEQRRGIERVIPTLFEWTGADPPDARAGAVFDRETPIDNIEVSTDAGTPDDTDVSDDGRQTTIRIGDPNTTITGVHTYRISYRLKGVLSAFKDHDELYLNITGNEWSVPIAEATATITLPADSTRLTCFSGPAGSQLTCDTAKAIDLGAQFSASNLGTGEGLTAVVALPKGVVDDPNTTRLLKERWSLAGAFALNAGTGTAGGALALGGAAGIGLLAWRNGRDRRYAGGEVDAAFGNDTGEDAPIPLFDQQNNPVEFVPPEGIRPGHLGTLWDEQANHLDVSAMIVDLAVRGWLRIDELAPADSTYRGIGNSTADFQLVQLRDPASDPLASELWQAERALLDALFATGNAVTLSSLKTKFSDKLELIQSRLYDDAVDAGWFPIRPDRVRARWAGRGIALLVAGGVLVWLAAKYTHLALIVAPIPLLGLALIATARLFPRRSAKGSALLGRVRGFKELFDAGEGERQQFAEAHHIFAQYLPYAIVFGCTEKWAQTFADLGLTPQEMGQGVWYTSPYGYDPIHFGWAMSNFTTYSTGSLAAAAPSSTGGASSGGSGFGGGFSGGGFGGGGGGDW